MEKVEREKKFDDLILESKRIISAKKSLFIGKPYFSKMKPGKEKTYQNLNLMQDKNIEAVANLFKIKL